MTGPRRAPWWWRALLIGTATLAFLLATVGSAGPAAAHARLVDTDPAEGAVLREAPDVVVLTFDEPVNLPGDAVRVFDARGGAVAVDAGSRDEQVRVDLPGAMAHGTYVVTWRAVSTDGHPIAGALTFSVGRKSAAVAPPPVGDAAPPGVTRLLGVAQGVGYGALFLTAGLAFFAVLLLPGAPGLDLIRRRLARVTGFAAATVVVAAVVAIPLTAGYQQGLGVAEVFRPSAWAAPAADEAAGLVALALGLVLVACHLPASTPTGRSRAYVVSGVVLLVGSPAFTGHTRAFSPGWLVVTTDVLHVLAGSVWLGGLVGLALTLTSIAGRGPSGVQALARFSAVAAGVLAALLVSGSLLSWRILGSWANLTGTAYGLLLLAKTAVVAAAVAIAAWNRFVLLPRVHQATRLGRTAGLEAACLVCVLMLTGFLVHQAPREPATAAAHEPTGPQAARLGELRLVVAMTPGTPGRNTLLIRVEDTSGKPVDPVRLPVVSLRTTELSLGEVRLSGPRPGTFRATAVIPTPGTWKVQVSLWRSQFENPVATVGFRVAERG